MLTWDGGSSEFSLDSSWLISKLLIVILSAFLLAAFWKTSFRVGVSRALNAKANMSIWVAGFIWEIRFLRIYSKLKIFFKLIHRKTQYKESILLLRTIKSSTLAIFSVIFELISIEILNFINSSYLVAIRQGNPVSRRKIEDFRGPSSFVSFSLNGELRYKKFWKFPVFPVSRWRDPENHPKPGHSWSNRDIFQP